MDGGGVPLRSQRDVTPTSWRNVLLLEVLLIMGAVVVSLTWSWRHPHVLVWEGDEIQVHDRPGATALVGITSDPFGDEPQVVTLHSARPRMASLPVGVTVNVKICRRPVGDLQVLSDRGPLSARCARVDEVAGATLNLADRTADQLVAVVRSTKPQLVTIRGVDVSYSAGWHRGHQTTGPTVVADFGNEDRIDSISFN